MVNWPLSVSMAIFPQIKKTPPAILNNLPKYYCINFIEKDQLIEEYQFEMFMPGINLVDFYFVSRHPKHIEAKIRPFDSLNEPIWAAIGFSYTIIIIASTVIFRMLKSHLPEYERMKSISRALVETLFDASSLHWQEIVKSGGLFRVLIAFNLWSFAILYGIKLRGALIGQDFESQVNQWSDLTLFDTHIIEIIGMDGATGNTSPTWHYYDFHYISIYLAGWSEMRSRKLYSLQFGEDFKVISNSMAEMQMKPNPNDIVLVASE